jgi:hypothetical protein
MSSETGKRNADRLNMIGVVVVGICGAVLTYVSIALLQAFYMDDTEQVESAKDFGGQDSMARDLRAKQIAIIKPTQATRSAAGTFNIPIERAMELVVQDFAADPAKLVPTQGRSDKPTVQPIFGRPKLLGQGGAGAAPTGAAPAGECDAASCEVLNYEGACCEKFKPATQPTGGGAPPPPAGGSGAAPPAPAPAPRGGAR